MKNAVYWICLDIVGISVATCSIQVPNNKLTNDAGADRIAQKYENYDQNRDN